MSWLRQTARPDERGVALVLVLWLIVLLGVIATGFSGSTRATVRAASEQATQAELRAAAEAGLNRAILDLVATGQPDPWPVDGSARSLTLSGQAVTVSIRDASGLLDLNGSGAQLLAAALDYAGADPEALPALVDAILDWRDADELRRLNGAEAPAYAARGLPWSPHNGPFASIDELRYVAGMNEYLFARLAPLVTVHSRRPGVNIEYAPPALVQALTDATLDVSGSRQSAASPQRRARAGSYHIAVQAVSPGAPGAVRLEAVVRTMPTSARSYVLLDWRDTAWPAPAGGN